MFLFFSHPSRARWCGSNEIPDKMSAVECFDFDKAYYLPDVKVRRSTMGEEVGFCLVNVTSQMLIHAPGSYAVLQNWVEDRKYPLSRLHFVCQDRLANRDDQVLARLADEVSEIQKRLRGLSTPLARKGSRLKDLPSTVVTRTVTILQRDATRVTTAVVTRTATETRTTTGDSSRW